MIDKWGYLGMYMEFDSLSYNSEHRILEARTYGRIHIKYRRSMKRAFGQHQKCKNRHTHFLSDIINETHPGRIVRTNTCEHTHKDIGIRSYIQAQTTMLME